MVEARIWSSESPGGGESWMGYKLEKEGWLRLD